MSLILVDLAAWAWAASGPPVRLCTNRRYLGRAAALGFTQFEIVAADVPVVCRQDQRVYLWMPLGDKSAIPPGGDSVRIASELSTPMPTSSSHEKRSNPMPAPQPNGHNGTNGPSSTGTPERWGLAEVIAEAEAMRGLLQDATTRTARLLAALKQQGRQSRAVRQAIASLRDLQLGP